MSNRFTTGRLRIYEELMQQPPRRCNREETLKDLRCKFCIRKKDDGCNECPYIPLILDAMKRGGVARYTNRYGEFSLNGRVVIPHTKNILYKER